ncbi:hypothetical protein Nm8I071_54280 [Nonomuraea sp. TT08I-71]|nr:hypothetical protein Nm8I071_54280 [Nonomuraea sp. TT08I-71]
MALDLGDGQALRPGLRLALDDPERHSLGMSETSDTHPANLSPTPGRATPDAATGSAGRAARQGTPTRAGRGGIAGFVPARRARAHSFGAGGSFVCLHRDDTTGPWQCS